MDADKLYVQMLGGVSLVYNGKSVTLERNSGTKATQLLLYMLYRKGEFVSREKLVEVLYGNDNLSNPQNNLKVNIFRLRRLLAASHLPDFEYIVHKSGRYSWQSDCEVVIDAKVFAKTVADASDFRRDRAARLERLQEAVSLYTGEFLPMIAAEPWVAVEASKYRNMYMDAVRALVEMLRVSDRYDETLKICNQAIKLSPYDEDMHIMRISAYLDLRKFREAMAAYDDASQLFFDELGIPPSQQMLDVYKRISGDVRQQIAPIEEIKSHLNKDRQGEGAYYCNYPSFIVGHQFVSRFVQRYGQSMYLMLCTLTDASGIPLELGDKLSQAAETLSASILASLRNCDMYTRYSPCQFLMLLIGINRESCDTVARRVSNHFRNNSNMRGIRVQHSFTSGLELEQTENNTNQIGNIWNR